jgi:hypothetical protein
MPLKRGVKANKMILVLGLSAQQYVMNQAQATTNNAKFFSLIPFATYEEDYCVRFRPHTEENTVQKYISFSSNDQWYITWGESISSIALKSDYANNKNLKGINKQLKKNNYGNDESIDNNESGELELFNDQADKIINQQDAEKKKTELSGKITNIMQQIKEGKYVKGNPNNDEQIVDEKNNEKQNSDEQNSDEQNSDRESNDNQIVNNTNNETTNNDKKKDSEKNENLQTPTINKTDSSTTTGGKSYMMKGGGDEDDMQENNDIQYGSANNGEETTQPSSFMENVLTTMGIFAFNKNAVYRKNSKKMSPKLRKKMNSTNKARTQKKKYRKMNLRYVAKKNVYVKQPKKSSIKKYRW